MESKNILLRYFACVLILCSQKKITNEKNPCVNGRRRKKSILKHQGREEMRV